MTRPLTSLLLILLAPALGGCWSDLTADSGGTEVGPSAGLQRVEARDGSFTVDVPKDWTSRPDILATGPDDGQLLVEAPDPAVQLVASTFHAVDGAEDHAVYLVAGFVAAGMDCARREGFTGLGGTRLVLDCWERRGARTIRSVLIPMPREGRSTLLLVQIWGDSLAGTAATILSSWRWR